MRSLYQVLKASKFDPVSAPDMFTALWAKNISGGGSAPTEHEYTGTVPYTYNANGEPLLDWYIKGNTVQNGTPTPDNPIMPQGTGERTENRVNADDWYSSYKNGDVYTATGNTFIGINIKPFTADDIGKTFTFSAKFKDIHVTNARVYAVTGGTASNGNNVNADGGQSTITVTVASIDDYLRVSFGGGGSQTMSVYEIMLVEGSTTPSSYIPPGIKIPISSCGENLCNPIPYKKDYYIDANGVETPLSQFDIYKVSASAETTYTISLDIGLSGTRVRIHAYKNGSWVEEISEPVISSLPETFTTPQDCDEIRFSITHNAVNHIMLNTGSTALPFKPYNRTTTPVYLGEVQTTRKIKKLVLTGEESWYKASSAPVFYHNPLQVNGMNTTGLTTVLSTHYGAQPNVSNVASVGDLKCCLRTTQQTLYIGDSNFATLAGFESYLAVQYAAGTPVCVWYVLKTEETAVVNEPLMKIGDYADEVSNVATIPTVNGSNTIDVDTTVKPSEIYIKYKG